MAVTVSVCGSLAAPELMPPRPTKCTPLSSPIDMAGIASSVGASLTGSTVSKNDRLVLPFSASVTVTVTVTLPDWLVAGSILTERLAPVPPRTIFASGNRFVFEETAFNVSAPSAVSMSLTLNKTVVAVSSGVLASAMPSSTGRSFTGSTVTVKEVVMKRLSGSRTSRVMTAEPKAFVAGRICSVRLPPTPPRRMPLTGTSVGFDENCTTVSALTGVS